MNVLLDKGSAALVSEEEQSGTSQGGEHKEASGPPYDRSVSFPLSHSQQGAVKPFTSLSPLSSNSSTVNGSLGPSFDSQRLVHLLSKRETLSAAKEKTLHSRWRVAADGIQRARSTSFGSFDKKNAEREESSLSGLKSLNLRALRSLSGGASASSLVSRTGIAKTGPVRKVSVCGLDEDSLGVEGVVQSSPEHQSYQCERDGQERDVVSTANSPDEVTDKKVKGSAPAVHNDINDGINGRRSQASGALHGSRRQRDMKRDCRNSLIGPVNPTARAALAELARRHLPIPPQSEDILLTNKQGKATTHSNPAEHLKKTSRAGYSQSMDDTGSDNETFSSTHLAEASTARLPLEPERNKDTSSMQLDGNKQRESFLSRIFGFSRESSNFFQNSAERKRLQPQHELASGYSSSNPSNKEEGEELPSLTTHEGSALLVQHEQETLGKHPKAPPSNASYNYLVQLVHLMGRPGLRRGVYAGHINTSCGQICADESCVASKGDGEIIIKRKANLGSTTSSLSSLEQHTASPRDIDCDDNQESTRIPKRHGLTKGLVFAFLVASGVLMSFLGNNGVAKVFYSPTLPRGSSHLLLTNDTIKSLLKLRTISRGVNVADDVGDIVQGMFGWCGGLHVFSHWMKSAIGSIVKAQTWTKGRLQEKMNSLSHLRGNVDASSVVTHTSMSKTKGGQAERLSFLASPMCWTGASHKGNGEKCVEGSVFDVLLDGLSVHNLYGPEKSTKEYTSHETTMRKAKYRRSQESNRGKNLGVCKAIDANLAFERRIKDWRLNNSTCWESALSRIVSAVSIALDELVSAQASRGRVRLLWKLKRTRDYTDHDKAWADRGHFEMGSQRCIEAIGEVCRHGEEISRTVHSALNSCFWTRGRRAPFLLSATCRKNDSPEVVSSVPGGHASPTPTPGADPWPMDNSTLPEIPSCFLAYMNPEFTFRGEPHNFCCRSLLVPVEESNSISAGSQNPQKRRRPMRRRNIDENVFLETPLMETFGDFFRELGRNKQKRRERQG